MQYNESKGIALALYNVTTVAMVREGLVPAPCHAQPWFESARFVSVQIVLLVRYVGSLTPAAATLIESFGAIYAVTSTVRALVQSGADLGFSATATHE